MKEILAKVLAGGYIKMSKTWSKVIHICLINNSRYLECSGWRTAVGTSIMRGGSPGVISRAEKR